MTERDTPDTTPEVDVETPDGTKVHTLPVERSEPEPEVDTGPTPVVPEPEPDPDAAEPSAPPRTEGDEADGQPITRR